ncbi:MJ1477/TM1410 family putative glycoside hydrolase [Methylobacterium durans]|uniref:MJ1477/TM1410 family putative glycoside hydrolase n=1 Tax=Methylobacterium durans TaxID=2202825 RepID=UPI002AFF8C8F|nr:MJ1477/TM1410 family putative glycoside hydrolase [Methylobacterium durans]MEA1832376.1 MJ1477/TM1410 family putative glycoside hydrolase [Methylobacterium durans]
MRRFMTRRSLLTSGLLGFAALAGIGAAPLIGRRVSARLASVDVRSWGCQYQQIDLGRVAASDLDMIVLDPVVDGERISLDALPNLRVKPDGGRRLVLAYLSVGEAESYRAYWQSSWRETPPDWLGPENARWPGSFAVKYWHPAWRAMIAGDGGAIDALCTAGFDGVFLDRVDAYGDWREREMQARREMVDLVGVLSARAKSQRPGFVVVAQNAEPLLMNDAYCGSIDAVSKESLLYNLHGEGVENTDDDVRWSMTYLERARARGLPVLAIEYLDDTVTRLRARARLTRLGFVPFFGNRLLDRLPV